MPLAISKWHFFMFFERTKKINLQFLVLYPSSFKKEGRQQHLQQVQEEHRPFRILVVEEGSCRR